MSSKSANSALKRLFRSKCAPPVSRCGTRLFDWHRGAGDAQEGRGHVRSHPSRGVVRGKPACGRLSALYSATMLKAGVGLACLSPKGAEAGVGRIETPEAGRAALERALGGALDQAGSADSALVFVTPGGVLDLPEILDITVSVLGTEAVVGATSFGVMAGGRELEAVPSVAVLVQSGVESEPFLISDLQRDSAGVGEEIAAHIGSAPRPGDLVILLPDPHALDPRPVLDGIRDALGPAIVVGAGAGDPVADHPQQWMGSRVETGALAGMVLRTDGAARIGVTQACRPVLDRFPGRADPLLLCFTRCKPDPQPRNLRDPTLTRNPRPQTPNPAHPRPRPLPTPGPRSCIPQAPNPADKIRDPPRPNFSTMSTTAISWLRTQPSHPTDSPIWCRFGVYEGRVTDRNQRNR